MKRFGTSVKGLGALADNKGKKSGFKFKRPEPKAPPEPAPPPKPVIRFDVPLGTCEDEPFGLNQPDREHHTHIIGSTGTGKSKFIELLIRHDVADRKAGLCLIDPHGSLYEDVLHYVSHEKPELADRLVLFNPAQETEHVIGFNPVVTDGEHLDYLLDSLVSACLKAWGQDSTDRTPRITKWLENIFYTIMVNDLTLVEAAPLLSIQNRQQREILLRNVHNDMVLDDWRMFEVSSNTQKQALIEGAANRLRKFLRNGLVRNIIGQKERVLDFAEVMDQGKIVLVNLNGQGAISHENTKLLGILLVNEIFRCSKLRNPRDADLKPFYFYIDEFAQFITRDIARALEEARKFKLFMVLAHQHLAQLRDEDEYLYASVLTNCKNKVVFGGLSREDAKIMADEVATGFVNLKAVKDEIYGTKTRQRLEKRTVKTKSTSSSQGTSRSKTSGQTEGTAYTNSETHGEQYSESEGASLGFRNEMRPAGEVIVRRLFGAQDDPSGWTQSMQRTLGESHQYGNSTTRSSSSSRSTTQGDSQSHSTSHGENETWVSVSDEYQELSNRTFWSLQELEHMEMVKLKNQGVAQAFVKLWQAEPKAVQIAHVEAPKFDKRSPTRLDKLRTTAIDANGSYFTALEQLQDERTARQVAAFGEPLKFSAAEIDAAAPDLIEDMIDDDDPFT
ncbi:MAG: type IV secretion system DNA-binding domain-containing protein [Pseudomonadota bacterium]